MGRRFYHTCFLDRTETITYGNGSTGTATYGVCGGRSLNSTTTDERRISCPDCAKKVGKRRLIDLAKLGTKLEAIPYTKHEITAEFGRYPSVKSIYRVKLNDIEIGRLGIDNGWGKGWWIKPIEPTDEEIQNPRRYHGAGTFSARDLALSFVPKLIADGKMFDGPGLEAIRKKRADAKAARNEQDRQLAAKMRQDRLEEDARNQEIYEGLLSIYDKHIAGQLQLSNQEASALSQALDLAKGKLRGQAALDARVD